MIILIKLVIYKKRLLFVILNAGDIVAVLLKRLKYYLSLIMVAIYFKAKNYGEKSNINKSTL